MKEKLFNEEGSIIVLVAVSMVVMLVMSALVIDISMVGQQKYKLQTAIDAAALAAADDLPDTNKAAATANHYVSLNGFSPSDISISFLDANQKIRITATKTVDYFFAKTIGLHNTDIAVSAAGVKKRIEGPFKYALFTGSTTTPLTLNGSSFNITGSTHSNSNFVLNCSSATITGACEAAGNISISGTTINVNNRVPNSPNVGMIDFSETVREDAEAAGNVYYGDKSYNQTVVNLDEPIYVYGNISFNTSQFTGNAAICATGNITFNGSNISASTGTSICVYSKNGNISVNSSTTNFDGILYAPNGNVALNTSSLNINGRVVSKTLSIGASSITIKAGTKELESLPKSGVKLVE